MSDPSTAPLEAPDPRSPWPGLDAFKQTDRKRFRGRKLDRNELYRRVTSRVATVLYGQSGLGKTSLLQAGLMPLLARTHYIPVNIHLIHGKDAPALMDQVRMAITRALEEAPLLERILPGPEEDIWHYLHRRDVPLVTTRGYDARLVLIFDQFEEIFTNGQSTAEQAAASKVFFTQLAELVQGRTPPLVKAELEKDPALAEKLKVKSHDYHVLVVLREDYYPHLNTAVERFLARDLIVDPQRLLPFDGESALQAVEGPGKGLLQEGVAEQIVRRVAFAKQRRLSVSFIGVDDDADLAMGDLRVEPALLSLLCSRLNASRLALQQQSGRKELITTELLQTTGERVLDDFYHDSIKLLPEAHRSAVALFIEEELLSDSGKYRQQVVVETAEETLEKSGMTRAEAQEAIRVLIQQRLLRKEDRGDVPRLELAHDVLCQYIGNSRDQRRAEEQRMEWWKNVATKVAVALFIVAIGLAIFSMMQRRSAIMERASAVKGWKEASDFADKAQESEDRAQRDASVWYLKDIRTKAGENNLSAAYVMRAHGKESAEVNEEANLVGHVAPRPTFSTVRKLKLDVATKRFIWTPNHRILCGITEHGRQAGQADRSQDSLRQESLQPRPEEASGEFWWLDGDFSSPRWLHVSGDEFVLDRDNRKERAKVLAASAWKRDSGEEGVLVSLEDKGLVFITTDGGVTHVTPAGKILGADITAILQEPPGGPTWIGFKSGVVARLQAGRLDLDSSFEYFIPPYQSSVPELQREMKFPAGKWKYSRSRPFRRYDLEADRMALWSITRNSSDDERPVKFQSPSLQPILIPR